MALRNHFNITPSVQNCTAVYVEIIFKIIIIIITLQTMAASRWSQSFTYDFNALLLKQRVSPISKCINPRAHVTRTPLARIGVGYTIRRVANGRLQTAVPRMIKREQILHSHGHTSSNVAVSQHMLWRHEAELVYEDLDRNIVTGSYSFLLEPYHARDVGRDVFTCGIVNTRTTNVSSFASLVNHCSSPEDHTTVAFSAEQREDRVVTEPPRDRPTPAQLSFVLLKLREEVCLRLRN